MSCNEGYVESGIVSDGYISGGVISDGYTAGYGSVIEGSTIPSVGLFNPDQVYDSGVVQSETIPVPQGY